MQDIIKQIKQEYIDKLKAKKAEYESRKATIVAQKFAEKKAAIAVENEQLDRALADYIQQKQAAFDKEIAEKRQEVANKKAESELCAKVNAETEADAEILGIIKEIDAEISLTEKSL